MIADRFASDSPRMIRLDETTSTNTALAAMPDARHGTVVITDCQTAGRGQRGNSWEAAPGLNVTMSILLEPRSITAAGQFAVSEIVALGVANIISLLARPDDRITVKWPNDIYAGDRKIAGILIENTLAGNRIIKSIAGIGVNINQPRFESDAPNPVSLLQLTGIEQHIPTVADLIAREILSLADLYDTPSRLQQLHEQYISMLWRRDGFHPYIDTATGRRFSAAIADVAPTGHITLIDESTSHRHTYAFKEVQAVID
ncbi:MAG: biotin--[acetyl-CoA-carboxylase] ligase [Duncaniella sp.]|nr:biotin--[acetyl-CoA-carboxylase] ligase [Duncaniella sp.]MDE6582565.1 biotin--[acetyl-CoA-carboxylase] ligase [Duncaniella sp.]